MSDSQNEAFGRRLRQLYEARGFTKASFARAAGVAYNTIDRYESGVTSPDVPKLRDLAKALGVSVGELVDGELPRFPPRQPWRGSGAAEVCFRLRMPAKMIAQGPPGLTILNLKAIALEILEQPVFKLARTMEQEADSALANQHWRKPKEALEAWDLAVVTWYELRKALEACSTTVEEDEA